MEAESKIRAPEKVPWFPWIGKRKRPYYGWVVVSAGWVEQFFQGIVSQGFATYLSPLQDQFGWSRATLAAPRSVTAIEGAILGPIEGYLVDRFGARIVIGIGAFIMGLGLILFGLIQTLWQYYAVSIFINVGFGLAGLLVMSVAVNHWFRRRRTIAQSIMLMGYATAGIVGIPILVWLQADFGWRTAAIISGIAVWALGIPAAMLFRRSPEAYGLRPDGDDEPVVDLTRPVIVTRPADFTLNQAIRTRTFWFLSVGGGLNGLAQSAMMVHIFLHLEDGVGLSRGMAALIWTITSIVNIPSRLLAGLLGDRFPKHILLGGFVTLMGLSILALGLANNVYSAILFAVLYGMGWGGRTPIANALHGQYWGMPSLGKIVGTLQSLAVPLSIVGPVVAGLLADARGDYRLVFICMSVASLAGAGLIFFASPPKQPQVEE